MWEDGWKERYYLNKFHVSSDDDDFVARVAESYVKGLCWVMGYYYQVILHPLCILPHLLTLSCSTHAHTFIIGVPLMEMVLSISLCTICV